MTSAVNIRLFSPAKINLFLHITDKRADGYHNLQTVFRRLDWGDTLNFHRSSERFNPHTVLHGSNLPITLKSNVTLTNQLTDNLITKAAIALIDYVKTFSDEISIVLPSSMPIIDIQLDKIVPTGAGLGGGSSNAAATLMALNQLWVLNLNQQTLINIGAKVGADVPIFILGTDAIAEGIGDKLTPISLPHQHYLLLNPAAHASTQALFSHPDLVRTMPILSKEEIKASTELYLNNLIKPYCNVFTPVVVALVPEVNIALRYLNHLEPLTETIARMSGSGSSVFLPIPANKLETIKNYITQVKIPPCDSVLTQSIID